MPAEPGRFEYVVWIRDLRIPPNDQDYEWPAVFAIDNNTAEAAQAWGRPPRHAYLARTSQGLSQACYRETLPTGPGF